ncbi:glucosyltransferase domain-containing protein [Mesorhizobium sp. B3-2-1]|uniref:glucosyltransferase domain-containing protein n=1 Tax=Mesorhizobium sp. B3-2-1 TaxID=2589891 RepID=UPI0015E48D73|nr:glucosyltransferase domain-containing protein [Mesorhizobium sp. B3-2-1]
MLTRPNTVRQAITLFVIFVAMYFSELASFSLSIDEELTAFRTDPSIWIIQGRWGAYLIERFLLPHPVMPFLTPSVFGAGCVAAYLLIMDIIDKRELSIAEYACFAIFCGFPTWFFIVEFYSNIAAVGIGLFASALALWLICKNDVSPLSRRFLGAVTAGGLAISIYQSFAPAILVLGIAISILQARTDTRKSFVKDLFRVAILLVGATMFYVIGNAVFRSFVSGSNAYFDSLSQPGFLFQHPIVVVGRVLESIGEVYGVRHGTYDNALWAIPLLLVLGGWTLLTESPYARLLLTTAAVAALVVPFGLHFLAAGSMPVRSLVGVPIAVWLLAYVAVTSGNSRIRFASAILLAVALFQIQVIQNYRQASSYLVDKHDTLIAGAIYERLSNTPGFDAKRTYVLSIFGSRPFVTNYPRPPASTVGYSFFEWDGGNPWRIASYMKLLGYSNLTGPTPDQIDSTIAHLSTMPVWPAPGSVEIQDNIALIRLGETPSYAYQQALARMANH